MQNILDVVRLGFGIRMGHIADMQDDIRFHDLLERCPEGRHQQGRQIGDEAHGVGNDDPRAVRQINRAQGRIEGGEQHVRGQDFGFAHAIE